MLDNTGLALMLRKSWFSAWDIVRISGALIQCYIKTTGPQKSTPGCLSSQITRGLTSSVVFLCCTWTFFHSMYRLSGDYWLYYRPVLIVRSNITVSVSSPLLQNCSCISNFCSEMLLAEFCTDFVSEFNKSHLKLNNSTKRSTVRKGFTVVFIGLWSLSLFSLTSVAQGPNLFT